MSNQYFGELIVHGKTVVFDTQKLNKKYDRQESLEILEKINDIILENFMYFRKQKLQQSSMDGYMDYSIISYPFYSSHVKKYMKKNLSKMKISFSKLFDLALSDFLKKPERNVLMILAAENKKEYYSDQIEIFRNRIKRQINRLMLGKLVNTIDQNVIIVTNKFEKEYFYDLPSNVLGFVCRNYDNHELLLDLSVAYEVPVVSTTRNVAKSNEILIDGFNKIVYLDPKEAVIQKMYELKNKYVYEMGDHPKYKSDVIKFYANLVDKRGIDKAKQSTWYNGVALFRTEYIFITKGVPPTKRELIFLYMYLLKSFKGKTVQIRLQDFNELKTPDYEDDVFTELDSISEFHRIYMDNIASIFVASKVTNTKTTIVIPMLRMGKEVELWKNQIEIYQGIDLPEDIKPNFGIMMETESAFLYFEDYREVDSLVFGLNDFLEEVMEISRHDSVDLDDFMMEVWHDLQNAHQYFRRNGIRLLHIVSGNVLRQPLILRKLIKKGFKHFAIPLSYIRVAEEVLFEHESTRGLYVGVHQKREKAKLNNKIEKRG